MSLAKLTAISTSTLSLLLERQRLQTLPQFTNQTSNPLHIPQITRNLAQLKQGVLDLEQREGRTEAVTLLRSQYERMRGMLGGEADRAGIERLKESEEEELSGSDADGSAQSSRAPSPFAKSHTRSSSTEPIYTPYADDPEAGPEPAILLQEQRRLMDDQDAHLDSLSHSIGRQRDISLQINDELGTQHGLLEELDHDLDDTQNSLSRARRRLGRFAKGAKENGSTLTIALLILVLLILIIVFKT